MHRLFKRNADPQVLMGAMIFWTAAPSLPIVAGYMARVSLASVAFQHQLVDVTAFLVALILVALSFWGAALIRGRLKASPLKDFGLVAPPVLGVLLAASAATFARWLAGHFLEDWGGAYGNYGVFVLVWAALVAQQLKYFWEHSLEAWETRRGDFMPLLPRFNPYSRWLAARALADRQAKAWIKRRRSSQTATERNAFKRWKADRVKAGGLRRQGHGIPWPLYGLLIVGCAAMVISYAYHTGRLPRPAPTEQAGQAPRPVNAPKALGTMGAPCHSLTNRAPRRPASAWCQ